MTAVPELGTTNSTALIGVPAVKAVAPASVVSQHLLLNIPQGIIDTAVDNPAQKSAVAVLIWTRSCEPPPVASVRPVTLPTLIANPVPEAATVSVGDGVAEIALAWLMFQPIPATDAYVVSAVMVPLAQSWVMAMKVAGITVALLPVAGPTNVYP